MGKVCHSDVNFVNTTAKILPKFLSDEFSSEKPWDTHKLNSQIVMNLYANFWDMRKYAFRISQCADKLEFAENENGIKLKKARFCRVRNCPTCQWRRQMLWRAVMFQNLPKITEQYSTYRWIFLTLTVKNCEIQDLRSTLQDMNKAWHRMAGLKMLLGVVAGYIRTTEVTRAKDGKAHPHYHVMMLVKPSFFGKSYIKQKQWAELWQKSLSADYEPMVHVKAIKTEQHGEIEKAICETLKYTVKPSDLAYKDDKGLWLREYTNQTKNMRFIATGGVLKGVIKPEDKISEQDMISAGVMEQENELDEVRTIYVYSPYFSRYVYNERMSILATVKRMSDGAMSSEERQNE